MDVVTAFILAGGRSSRMGSDKALLDLADKPLIVHALDLGRSVADDVKIVGEPKKFAAFGPVVADVYVGHGPLGGIHAALTNSSAGWNLILAVDLPFLKPEFLTYLVAQAQSSDAVVTVPLTNGYFQPLCAVYRKEFAIVAERALADGRNKIDPLFSEIPVRAIPEDEIVTRGFSSSMFRNLNTPEEWDQAKQDFGPE